MAQLGTATLGEDLLLLLVQPNAGMWGTGVIAGENTIFYVLGGGALADLGLGGHARTIPGWGGSTRVEAVADRSPANDTLRSAWDYVAVKPRGVQATLAEAAAGAVARTVTATIVSNVIVAAAVLPPQNQ